MELSKPFILDLDQAALADIVKSWGEPEFRARQIWEGIYRNLWSDINDFPNLPKNLRNKLSEQFIFSNLSPSQTSSSKDNQTEKTLFNLPEGLAIETVLMDYKKRRTVCVSSQAGCAMGCIFCATGQMGFMKNLTSGEIIEQVLYFARRYRTTSQELTNIVVMGMGEPFHNYTATLEAIKRLNDPTGLQMGSRRFTISTVGIIPGIQRFTEENHQINLAISLHAATDDLRSSLLPVNKKYPIKELLEACEEYVRKTRRRITFEWALINDVNDSNLQAEALSNLLQVFKQGNSMLCHVNMIPLNPTLKYAGKATTLEKAVEFCSILDRRGIPGTVRTRRGLDIQAGCGQLAVERKP